jgi:hypothetical protein
MFNENSSASLSFVVDGIRTIAIHNDVVRVQFMLLDNDGEPVDTVRLLIPRGQIQAITQAFRQIPG